MNPGVSLSSSASVQERQSISYLQIWFTFPPPALKLLPVFPQRTLQGLWNTTLLSLKIPLNQKSSNWAQTARLCFCRSLEVSAACLTRGQSCCRRWLQTDSLLSAFVPDSAPNVFYKHKKYRCVSLKKGRVWTRSELFLSKTNAHLTPGHYRVFWLFIWQQTLYLHSLSLGCYLTHFQCP